MKVKVVMVWNPNGTLSAHVEQSTAQGTERGRNLLAGRQVSNVEHARQVVAHKLLAEFHGRVEAEIEEPPHA
jgi:hypothetical protein